MIHTIKLTYFRQSGKYYSDGAYMTALPNMFQIFDEVMVKLQNRELPGLTPGHSPYYVHVDASEHPNGYPGLVVPREWRHE